VIIAVSTSGYSQVEFTIEKQIGGVDIGIGVAVAAAAPVGIFLLGLFKKKRIL